MTLERQTKIYIENYIKSFYYKAFEYGATLSEIEDTGANTYKCTLGNMTMLFIGTADGTARIVAAEGDIF